MAANDDITKKDLIENDDNKIVNISERLDKLEKDVESMIENIQNGGGTTEDTSSATESTAESTAQ